MSSVDYSDIQGLVRFGFGEMKEGCYFLLKIKDPRAARAWLRQAHITPAVKSFADTVLQVAFTREGLQALHVPPEVIEGFSTEFRLGMTSDDNRARRLGDIGQNSPEKWEWGYQSRIPHMVVMLFAKPGKLEGWKNFVCDTNWRTAFEETCLSTSDMGGREPFGFVDGISQPLLDWERQRKVSVNRDQITYGNLVCLGEFLLGYPNEYDQYTDRPLLDPQMPGSDELLPAPDQPGKKDLGLNGTYVVMRQLQQDVRGFWRFLDETAGGNPEARYRLAEAMVGRAVHDGAPLLPLNKTPIEGVGVNREIAKRQRDIELNQFTYGDDAQGLLCPFGAHVRRGNPRNADVPGEPRSLLARVVRMLGYGAKNVREDLVAATRFHRLLRRGREYGEPISPDEALLPGPAREAERGLHFVAVNANIIRQFEFIQNAWMARTKFDGLTEESDPLLGNREPVAGCPFTNTFSIPQANGVRRRIMDVPQFVTVRGGAYFFLPSLRAVKYLCRIGD